MLLQLLDLNSLKFGINFYEEFIDSNDFYDDDSGYLKFTVICIHNSVELFCKNMLSEIDELLIYKDISNDLLIRLGKEKRRRFHVSLHYSLIIGDIDVKTIDYSECIKRLKYVFDINEFQYQDLIKLSRIRNKVVHFGIDSGIDVHEILGVVNRTLNFIIEFFNLSLKNRLLYERILDI